MIIGCGRKQLAWGDIPTYKIVFRTLIVMQHLQVNVTITNVVHRQVHYLCYFLSNTVHKISPIIVSCFCLRSLYTYNHYMIIGSHITPGLFNGNIATVTHIHKIKACLWTIIKRNLQNLYSSMSFKSTCLQILHFFNHFDAYLVQHYTGILLL